MNKQDIKKVKTKNVFDAIQTYADENLVSVRNCDFTINHTATYIKTYANTEFLLFNEDISLLTREKILNEHIEFEQIYDISIKQRSEFTLRLNYHIDYGDFSTHPRIIIKHDSVIPYKTNRPKETYLLLLNEINKIKVQNKILINIFDKKMINNLKTFTKYLYQGKFKKSIRLPLFEGIKPTLNKQSKLIFWFKEKNNSKSRIIEVKKGETLVEYIKPVYGDKGLNAFGEILDSEYEGNIEDLEANVDKESITIKENEYKKLYISKKKGFVSLINNFFTVDNKIKMEKLSRVEKSLQEDEDNNIEVFVAQHDTDQDSIGEGVKLISETIHVTGHVGAKSILESINLTVDGATHKDSTQFAKFAKINRHKGVLRCHDANIKLLEGGEVHATNAVIEASLGGVIYAKNVTIGLVKSNLKVYASDSINIKRVAGEDNVFKINYKDIPIVKSNIDFLNEEIEDLKFSLEEAKKHTIEKVPEIQLEIKILKNKVDTIIKSAQNAQISIEEPLSGLNTIIFTIDDNNEIIYKTQTKKYKPFHVEINEDEILLHPVDKYIIKK